MKRSVAGVIGIEIDDEYKWKDTLIIDEHVSSQDEKTYINCLGFIKVIYKKQIDFSDSRKMEENIWGNEKYIYDSKKEAKIYFENNKKCIIETRQEVNEWLMIMLQIMLLKFGYSLIHAAAVANENGALLLPSWGGVGKTACVAKLVKTGYKILGDDFNIINKNGEIYGLPKKFVLYFYHRDLFPEVFKKKAPKCNSALNEFYSNIIPTVKNFLRKFPAVLAFARKHNPQSIKVSPVDIFGKEAIQSKSDLKQIIWLERGEGENIFNNLESKDIAQKATSVTLNEILTDNMSAILVMCGFGIISFNEFFVRMYEIYESAFNDKITNKLRVSKKDKVEVVADEVMKNIKF